MIRQKTSALSPFKKRTKTFGKRLPNHPLLSTVVYLIKSHLLPLVIEKVKENCGFCLTCISKTLEQCQGKGANMFVRVMQLNHRRAWRAEKLGPPEVPLLNIFRSLQTGLKYPSQPLQQRAGDLPALQPPSCFA